MTNEKEEMIQTDITAVSGIMQNCKVNNKALM